MPLHRRMKFLKIIPFLIFLISCGKDEPTEEPSLVGSWTQIEKKSGNDWQPLGEGSFWTIDFNADGTHTNSQGNFIRKSDCTGTWSVSGNRLTMTNNCGRRQQELNMHFSIEDSILTWVHEYFDKGERFKRK